MADFRAFLLSARTEVARYGDDDDVFVRELVQNARDACAHTISFARSVQGDHEEVSVDDDGSGMSRAVISSALLRLFSSQKTSSSAAGCFGVGFWSVLRFADVDVVVETHDGQDACALRIDLLGEQLIEEQSQRSSRGTRVLLRRRRRPRPFALRAAILRHACYVSCSEGPPPRLLFDGEVLNRPLQLGYEGGPDVGMLASRKIEGEGFRGVVGLSAQPHIELLHHGLRVVEASSLLALVPSKKRHAPRGLGVSARVDVDALTVLVDRKTVVEDGSLRAVVDACDAGARRLEREVLHDGAPLPLRDALWFGLQRALQPLRLLTLGFLTTLLGAALGFACLWMLRPDLRSRIPLPVGVPTTTATATATTTTTTATTMARALDQAALHFDSPRIDVRGDSTPGWDVDVDGVGTHQLRLFTLSLPDEARGLVARPLSVAAAIQRTGNSTARLAFRADTAGWIILPSSSAWSPVRVIFDGVSSPVLFADQDGNPLFHTAGPAVLHVDLVGATDGDVPIPPIPPIAPVPPSTSPALLALVKDLSPTDPVGALVARVQNRITYTADPASAQLFDHDRRAFVDRALALGRGDCDVINTVLVRALLAAGYEARLAVGLVIVDDVIADDLHAWAEMRPFAGASWQTLDASPPEARPRPTAPEPVAAATTSTPPKRSQAVAAIALGGLLFGLGGVGTMVRRRRQRRLQRAPVDLLPLFLAGLQSGAAEHLGLKRRPFLPTVNGRLLSLDGASALFARGRLARGSSRPSWLHPSVAVLDDVDPRVQALRPYLPEAAQLMGLRFSSDARLAGVQERIDQTFVGVRVCQGDVDAVTELHLRCADGGTHLVLVPPALLAQLDGADLVARIVTGASCLRALR